MSLVSTDKRLSAAMAAVDSHTRHLGIDGDHENKVRQLLASLYEYSGVYAVDLHKVQADVRQQIESGEIESPKWMDWNKPYVADNQVASPEQYAKDKGIKCPVCGSDDLDVDGDMETDGADAHRPAKCECCGATWNDLYLLVGYDDLEKK